MKNLLALAAVVLSVLVIYTVHQDRVREAAKEAAAEADARARSEALKWKRPTPPPKRATAVAISRVLEPRLQDLFAPLEQENAIDLVPPLQITKERILDKRQHVEAAKHKVYENAIRTLDLMLEAAEERTNSLDAMLRIAARPPSPLDARNTGTNSNNFFLQTNLKRWEAAKAQRKAAIEQAFAHLRASEREWNKVVGENAQIEDYDVASLPPAVMKVEQPTAAANPLERTAYDRRTSFTWRRSYYNQYNPGSVSY